MQGNYNEGDGYTGFRYDPPVVPGPENVPPNRFEPFDQYLSTGAPAERVEAPVPDAPAPMQAPYTGNTRESFGERFTMPPANDWQEPVYSQTQEPMYNMYTPGICVDHSIPNKRYTAAGQERKVRKSSGRFGRFMRTACLVLVCVILSGASAYGVMEYRLLRGDFEVTVNNQVVLGGAPSPQSSLLSPLYTAGGGMPAEDIYDLARTHVVKITTEASGSGGVFGMQSSSAVVSGSGFIISTDGYILTNYHVIETSHSNGLPLNVYLSDGTHFEATVIGYEVSNDFAVIKIDATGLNPAVVGDSDNIRVGQKVYAVGNPFGDLVYTMTDGIVSALDRVVTVDRKSINTFQFSAAVNSGNSGGPIYNTNGEVIGIVTAKLMRESVEGIGFAIPINDAILIASELIEHGYITGRPLMGVTVETFNSGHADFYNMVVGAIVRSVVQDSAAERAGIAVGDIVIALAGTEIESSDSLIFALRKFRAGDTTQITVWRSGEQIELTITFDENLSAGQPQQPQQQQTRPKPPEESSNP